MEQQLTGWRMSPVLVRGIVVACLGLGLAVVSGRLVVLVLVAPWVVLVLVQLVLRPGQAPRAVVGVREHVLTEGATTTLHVDVAEAQEAETLTVVADQVPWLRLRPWRGTQQVDVARATPRTDGSVRVRLGLEARRWGPHQPGGVGVGATAGWDGWAWGPVPLLPPALHVLPRPATLATSAAHPDPDGLVGAHAARRAGSGVEPDDIRAFAPGDRLRRINWRVSLRTGELHVVTSRAEVDGGVLLLVDAYGDQGTSEGAGGRESSLDTGVRVAAALGERLTGRGDRVGLRVLSGGVPRELRPGSGRRHQRRLLGVLAGVRADPGSVASRTAGGARLPVGHLPGGTLVVVLSSLLDDRVTSSVAAISQRGLPLIVVDTLGGGARLEARDGLRADVADLAWRLRLLERESLLARVEAAGCAVVRWSGPASLEEVLRGLSRRGRAPHRVAR
ncbi:DUF58 domain-containing protein [Nocardioides bruguierae]|uniref:DUF58 domain-containing protein n=1 Tax=Nocardioides bruguierae TaxID=2945102 RepID=A0A9X2D4S6_9ACTN|nr:DUF58 domain-containing protein [Nocardioides bruguierae]MCM0619055.1 DUF58 domain-containing protein [Nocardioides bruguierae]